MELFEQIKFINEQSLTFAGASILMHRLDDQALVTQAVRFGVRAHKGVDRKYTGVPYITHPIAVASIVQLVGGSPEQLAAAVLHDTVEDVDGITKATIVKHFGAEVAELVDWLTDISKLEDGNRAVRKAMDRAHSAQAIPEAKTVKLADLIHNTFSIVEHDKGFARRYLAEKLLLLDVLTEGDPELLKVARMLSVEGLATLNGAAKSASAFVR